MGMARDLSEMTLEELWRLFPIILRPHSTEYQEWFQEERHVIADALASLPGAPGNPADWIFHIGSTSVPGLVAKPTVDILMEISGDTDITEVTARLAGLGYRVMNSRNTSFFQLDFCKGYTPKGFAERVFHLHVRTPGDWNEPYFCEYLRRHPEAAAEYTRLKERLAVQFRNNRDAYTDGKTEFIRDCTERARRELPTGFFRKGIGEPR